MVIDEKGCILNLLKIKTNLMRLKIISDNAEANAAPAHAFVEDGLSDQPCATQLASTSIVEEITIKEEKSNAETN